MPLMTFGYHMMQIARTAKQKQKNLNNSISNIINVYEMYKHKIPDR